MKNHHVVRSWLVCCWSLNMFDPLLLIVHKGRASIPTSSGARGQTLHLSWKWAWPFLHWSRDTTTSSWHSWTWCLSCLRYRMSTLIVGKYILLNPLLFVVLLQLASRYLPSVSLEEMEHEGFAGSVFSAVERNKSVGLCSWETPVGLFIWLISDTCGTTDVIPAYLQSPERLDLRQSQRLFTAQGLQKMLYLCTITNEDSSWRSSFHHCFKHTEVELWPRSSQELCLPGLSSRFFSVQRNTGCYCVIMCLSTWAQ